MNITRASMRADGLTVGQAMDRDAAALRSLGIPAKDGAWPLDEQKEEAINAMRETVLNAMDSFALSMTGSEEDGPKDSELNELFAAIDGIALRIWYKKMFKTVL